ncbi:MAG: class I SAM-dependent methyltransferase [Gammaproteobacteria bacterium]|nr:class I SAM-dependent methyltransferase [Gammaproteobacteria bacterium]
MRYQAYAQKLPGFMTRPLFGDRNQFGLTPDESDACWKEWTHTYHEFYERTQKQGVGAIINESGYKILESIDLTGLNVLEVGPGGLYHTTYWKGQPNNYVLVDIDKQFLDTAAEKLENLGVASTRRLTDRDASGRLPAEDGEFDLIISFYSLEHLYPFPTHFKEILRVLRPGGQIAGAIPAEGGLAWGLGRFLTSRRWLKRNTRINPDKIICWEHPTLADEILDCLSTHMSQKRLSFWPLQVHSIDFNLVVRFIFQKPLGLAPTRALD